MTTENHPAGRDIIIKDICPREIDYYETDGQPLLDESGNVIIDENGNIVHGGPSH